MGNNKSYYIETFGCEMNKSDSIDIALSFEELGYKKAENEIEANVIILNTCAVRENAEERVLGRLGYYRSFKERHNRDAVIVLAGCMAQERGQDLVRIFPEIDVVSGTSHIMDIPGLSEERSASKGPVIALDKNDHRFSNYRGKRAEGYKAWVNIITGCSNYCSYCVVPYLRGTEKSKSSSEIITEIKEPLKNLRKLEDAALACAQCGQCRTANWPSKGIFDSSAGVTIISAIKSTIKPMNPMGPAVLHIGADAIDDNANTLETPSILNFHAILIIIIARGNSYAIIVAISLCAPTVA